MKPLTCALIVAFCCVAFAAVRRTPTHDLDDRLDKVISDAAANDLTNEGEVDLELEAGEDDGTTMEEQVLAPAGWFRRIGKEIKRGFRRVGSIFRRGTRYNICVGPCRRRSNLSLIRNR